MKPEEQFWMVWNLARRPPTVTYTDGRSAQLEAERLAHANPGERFYVVKGLRYVEVAKPVSVVELPQPTAPAPVGPW